MDVFGLSKILINNMCGIFGYIGKIEHEKALYCLNTLSHRGPDGYGVYESDGIFLGHRRLAILDLSEKGKQPMSYSKGRYWITFNGEIYNFLEIREELIAKGYSFESDSDTEVVMASFLEWKEKCLDRFNGMWAMAIWDREKRELFISRDRFGKKPLFYADIAGDFAFASEMKAIAPLLEKVEADKSLVMDIKKIFYYESTDKCLIKGIRRFPAGHYAYVKDGKLDLVRYWCTLDHLVEVPETYEDQVKQFRELFIDACRIRMRSDVPIGTSLSGGLDSSAVFCALAYINRIGGSNRVAKNWQHAFCASFPGTPLDEVVWAKKVADYCGADINILNIKPEDYLGDFYRDIYLFEDLYITPHIPFVANYGAMRKRGIVVTLDGHGADELFGGYSFDFLHILYDNMFNLDNSLEVLRTYQDTQIKGSNQFRKSSGVMILFLKNFIKNAVKKIIGYKNINPDDKHPNWRKLDYFTQKLYISFHQTVLPTLLRNYDRYSMINGVEVRMPFMDHRIVSYAFSLSWKSKIRNGYTKAIIRDALKDIMPEEVVSRKTKIGFNAPMVDWFKGPLKPLFIEAITANDFDKCPFINPQNTKNEVYNIINNPAADFFDAEKAWKLVSPYFWMKGFLNKIQNV